MTYDLGMEQMWARQEAREADDRMMLQAAYECREREAYERRAYEQWLQDQWIDSLEVEDFESYQARD